MKQNRGTGMLSTLRSVLAAAVGVQSSSNRKHDFENGKPLHFIVAGIIFTILFIATLVLIVRWLIASNT